MNRERVGVRVKPVMSAMRSDVVEVAMAVRENEAGIPLADHINPYEFVVYDNGRVNLEIKRETLLGDYEYQGMMAMADLFRGGCNWVEWISPPGGISDYPGTRICLLKGEAIEGGVKFKGWGICSEHTSEECLQLAREQMKRGAEVPGLIFNFDDLRKTPLGFKSKDDQLMALMRETIDLTEVWDSIENGIAQKGLEETVVMVSEILKKLEPEVRGKMSDYQFQYWFEIQLAQRGRFLGQGAHGGSVLGGGVGGPMGAFDTFFGMLKSVDLDHRLEECPKCHKVYMKKKGKCPECNGG